MAYNLENILHFSGKCKWESIWIILCLISLWFRKWDSQSYQVDTYGHCCLGYLCRIDFCIYHDRTTGCSTSRNFNGGFLRCFGHCMHCENVRDSKQMACFIEFVIGWWIYANNCFIDPDSVEKLRCSLRKVTSEVAVWTRVYWSKFDPYI